MNKIIFFAIIFICNLNICGEDIFDQSEAKEEPYIPKTPIPNIVLPTDSTGKIVYDSVIQIPGIAKDVLFNKAQEWFVGAFKQSKNVIEVQDKEAELISGKGFFYTNTGSVLSNGTNGVNFKVTLRFKDEKFRYTLTDFYHEGLSQAYPSDGGPLELVTPKFGKFAINKRHWNQIKIDANHNVLEMLNQLIKTVSNTRSDNW